jgi:hypothetical protein
VSFKNPKGLLKWLRGDKRNAVSADAVIALAINNLFRK